MLNLKTQSYPFGSPMPGRQFVGTGYKYGFNGKENDKETVGTGSGTQDYGERIYNPTLGKFLSVDPLTKEYPWLTPYQFASNTPIQAVDLDGNEAFFIHGTESDFNRWFVPSSGTKIDVSLIKGLVSITNNTKIDASFSWNVAARRLVDPEAKINNYGDAIRNVRLDKLNHLTNDDLDRKVAAQMLTNHVMAFRKLNNIDKYDDKGNLISLGAEPVTLIGHSHGGNVAIQAAKMLYDKFKIQSDIITIATPAYQGKDSPENPESNPGIRRHIAIWNKIDGVSGGLAGGDYYKGKLLKTINIEVDASGHYKSKEVFDAHSFDNKFMADFVKQVKANPLSDFLRKK